MTPIAGISSTQNIKDCITSECLSIYLLLSNKLFLWFFSLQIVVFCRKKTSSDSQICYNKFEIHILHKIVYFQTFDVLKRSKGKGGAGDSVA